MADIKRYPFTRHLRSAPTSYVRHLRRGRAVHEGVGAAFWFGPFSAALSEVPVDDRELPLLFHARTADFQDLAVQATITYRVVQPAVAAERIDFSVDLANGRWRGTPLEQLAGLLVESAQQHASDLIATMTLSAALIEGLASVRERIAGALGADQRLAATGLAVLDVRVVALRPEADVERALQTPAREQVQGDADRATYERRANAVERERAISENELQNQIELARREEQLVGQRGTNNRKQAEEAAAADRVAVAADAHRDVELARARSEGQQAMAEAVAAGEEAKVAPYRELSEATLLGLAVKELAGNLPQVQSLVISPELLTPILARLAGQQS